MPNERRAALELLCRTHGVAIMYAFGSRSKELYNWLEQGEALLPSRSDIDIGVRAAPSVFWQVKDKVHLAIALEDLFDCPRVDLIVLNEADPFLAAEVIRGERLYHEISPEELYRICIDTLRDIESIQDTYRRWVNEHPEKVEPGFSS